MGWHFTEMQKKSNGGTEQTCKLLEYTINKNKSGLLDDFQIIPSRISELQKDKIRVYHLHDLPNDPETNHLAGKESRNRFHKIVFCGNWQYNQYLNVLQIQPEEKFTTIDTPIVPLKEEKKDFSKEIRLIYTSTPQRGLEILVPVFIELAKEYPNIHLDVFSSFTIYGWEKADERFSKLFDICKNHPQITYHGFQPNDIVREHLLKAHIFSYPSIWMECNSRSLIEAMSAGCLCLHSNLGGLGDTSGGLTSMYQFVPNYNEHARIFYGLLKNSIEIVSKEEVQNYLYFVKRYADIRYDIESIAKRWEFELEELKRRYSTLESREIPEERFVYKI